MSENKAAFFGARASVKVSVLGQVGCSPEAVPVFFLNFSGYSFHQTLQLWQ
jgi:hypothetical protein